MKSQIVMILLSLIALSTSLANASITFTDGNGQARNSFVGIVSHVNQTDLNGKATVEVELTDLDDSRIRDRITFDGANLAQGLFYISAIGKQVSVYRSTGGSSGFEIRIFQPTTH